MKNRVFLRASVASLFLLIPAGSLAAGEPASDAAIDGAVRALASDDFSAREEAWARLLDWGATSPDRVLARLPETPDDEQMKAACARLRRRLPTEGMRRALLAEVRDAASSAFNRNWTPESAAETLDAFFDNPGADGAQRVSGIFRVPPREVADALSLFEASPDPALRLAVLSALDRIDKARARRLAESFIQDPDPTVRAQAVGFLARLADGEAIPLVAGRLDDPKREVRIAAIQALVGMAGTEREALPVLRTFARRQFAEGGKEMDRILASHALRGLVQAKDVESAPFIADLTDQFDLTVRATAIQALGELGDRRFAARVAGHLDDPEAFIRNVAARALARLSGDKQLQEACADQLAWTMEDQIFFFVAKEEDLQLGGGAEGTPPDRKAIAAAKAWWAAHRDDPACRETK